MLAFWRGSWKSGPNGYTADFHHNPATGWTTVNAEWDLGGLLDWGTYPPCSIITHPKLIWQGWNVKATSYVWAGQLLVTA